MAALVVANLPQRVRGRIATGKRGRPREDQPAFHYPGLREAALPAVDLVEVERVTVASQNRQLHMLAFADRVADVVKDQVPDFEVIK